MHMKMVSSNFVLIVRKLSLVVFLSVWTAGSHSTPRRVPESEFECEASVEPPPFFSFVVWAWVRLAAYSAPSRVASMMMCVA